MGGMELFLGVVLTPLVLLLSDAVYHLPCPRSGVHIDEEFLSLDNCLSASGIWHYSMFLILFTPPCVIFVLSLGKLCFIPYSFYDQSVDK